MHGLFACLHLLELAILQGSITAMRHDSRKREHRSWLSSLALVLLISVLQAVLVQAHPDATTEAADLLEEYTAISNSSLKWVQRPNLYFGMRARVQGDSPLFGIAWYGTADYNGYQSRSSSSKLR